MGTAARKPQASSPNNSILLFDDSFFEDVSLVTHIRKLIQIDDEISIEDSVLKIGTLSQISLSSELDVTTNLFHFYLVNIVFSDEIKIDVYQNFTEQLIPVTQVDSGDAIGRLDNLERDLTLFSTNPNFYKEFVYDGDSLTGYSIYTDATKTEELMTVSFVFSGEDLSQKIINRISDSSTLSIGFNYLNGNLISQTRLVS